MNQPIDPAGLRDGDVVLVRGVVEDSKYHPVIRLLRSDFLVEIAAVEIAAIEKANFHVGDRVIVEQERGMPWPGTILALSPDNSPAAGNAWIAPDNGQVPSTAHVSRLKRRHFPASANGPARLVPRMAAAADEAPPPAPGMVEEIERMLAEEKIQF